MQTLPAKDYGAITNPGNIINMSPGDDCIGMDSAGLLTGFRVGVRSAVIPFFQSLSPCYQQSPGINDKSVSYDTRPAAPTGQSALKDICQGAGFAAQLAGAWVPEVKLLADVVAKLSTYGNFGSKVIEYLQEQNAIHEELSAPKSTGEQHRSCAQNNVPQAALVASTIVALAQIPIAAAAPDSSKAPIPVPDRETLAQIGINGKSGKYPSDGHYIQTEDINSDDVSIGSEEKPFEGHYDGGCHTISGQKRCLFGKLDGVVSNLRMAQAHVENDDKFSAVVACKMGEGSRLESLLVEHSSVVINKLPEDSDPGSERPNAGVVTGHQQRNSFIEQVEVNNCSMTSKAAAVSVGIISGQNEGDIRHSTVNNGRVKTVEHEVHAGIGAGEVKGHIDHFTVLNSKVESKTEERGDIFSGIGGGKILSGGRLEKLTAVNSSVEIKKTPGAGASKRAAGIGAGENVGLLKGITAISCNLTTDGDETRAGIGAGINGALGDKGDIFDIRAIRCVVSTSGSSSRADTRAGIGAGYFDNGRIEGIAVLDSKITADGATSKARIGAGEYDSRNFPFPFNNSALINMTNSIQAVNVIVNGELKNIGNVSQAALDQLCNIADQRFIANDCRVTGQFSKDDWSCGSTVAPTVLSLGNLTASATALLNNSGAPAVSLVTGAESGAALSAGAIAGITVGVVGALGLGALFAWRYYVHRSDPDIMTMRVLNSHRKHSRFQMGKMSDFD